jgi:hypothetical protein
MAGCCECGDEPSGSCATELVRYIVFQKCTWGAQIMSADRCLVTSVLEFCEGLKGRNFV